jgi:uncharacterized phage protein (TIGR01671 family)
MREILFRGKSLIDNEWVIGAGVYKSEGYTWIITDDATKTENRGTGSDAIIPETVGQFTGLTDKNGKKIFEGDIIYRDWFGGLTYQVVYDDLYASFFGETTKGDFTTFNGDGGSFVIIGNIHDNPELLEVR